MRLYRDRAVVLRQHKLGEADRIVTLLTREHGLVRAVAKGVRRTRSKFGARLEPFAHIDVQLHPGRNLDIVTQVQAIDAFASDIVSDYGRYTCGCAMLETAERLAGEEHAPVPELHRLTVGALRAVADGNRPRELVLDAYLLRAMGIAGWAPALDRMRPLRDAGPAPGVPRRRRRQRVRALPPVGFGHAAAGRAGSDGRAARRRLGGGRGVPRRRTAARPAGWWPRTCNGTSNGRCGRCRWSNGSIGSIPRSLTDGPPCSGRIWPMALKRGKNTYPQLPPAPDDYPTFPDKSTWPVVFPELPPKTNGPFSRPPQHTSKESAPLIPDGQVPNHVAVVMDGNGRWATQRGLGRTEGHKMGEAVLIDITCGAIEIGIKHLTVYAFSTENWKRSAEEVRFLMGFNREVVRRRRENLNAMGVRMRWVGSRPRMWRSVIKEFDIAEQMTVDNDVITINYCVNYGGRTEIVEAARELAQQAVDGKVNPEPDHRGHLRQAPAPRRHPRRRPVHPDVGGAAGEQLPAVAGGVRRVRVPGQAVARLRPPRPVGGVHGVRQPQPKVRAGRMMPIAACSS